MRRVTLLVFLLCTACATHSGSKQIEVVYVNVVGACPTQSLPGATGELVGRNGAILAAAVAGVDGALRFSKRDMESANLLIVCHKDYSCGAMKLDARVLPASIVLAPQMAIQTIRVDPHAEP